MLALSPFPGYGTDITVARPLIFPATHSHTARNTNSHVSAKLSAMSAPQCVCSSSSTRVCLWLEWIFPNYFIFSKFLSVEGRVCGNGVFYVLASMSEGTFYHGGGCDRLKYLNNGKDRNVGTWLSDCHEK